MKSMIGTGAAVALAAGLALLPVLSTPGANAQQDKQQDNSTVPPASSPAAIPDHKLDAVAAAAKRVVTVSDRYEEKLAKAPANEKEQIIDEANQAIAKAVTDQGLSVDEYVSIMKVAQNDSAVRDEIVKRLK